MHKLIIALITVFIGATGALARDVEPPAGFRANRVTYSPVMDVLASSRDVVVTEAQLLELASLQLEAIWDGLGDYRGNYVRGFRATQPGKRLVGRALTMRFLPPRPDLRQALDTLAGEGDWDRRYYGRVADEAQPGDVVVADVGGATGDQAFGGVGALAMRLAGVAGAVIEGGNRDLAELRDEAFADFPVYTRFFDIDTAEWLGAEWNVPVRIGNVTVLPGDIVVADDSGAVFVPPQLVAEVLSKAREKATLEERQRDLLRERRHRFRDVYPKISPALDERYERGERVK
jgi:regulator of RNase E activity RraA